MKARNRMLWRDLWHLRGQVIAAALVVGCGVAAFVSMRATYESLLRARDDYYQAFRFADVFVSLKRAPLSIATRIAEIPGVAQVRTRVVLQVTLDVPRLAEPASGRLVSIPERPRAMLNDLSLRAGRYVEPGRDDEIIASEAFAVANDLKVGDSLGAVMNGRWKWLRIVGVALSPEYIYEVGAGTIFPDNQRFGVMWMGETALASAYNMEGAFNDVALALAAGASQADVIERLDLLLVRYGGLGAYGRDEQLSHRFISDEIAQNRVTSTFVPGIFLGVAAFLLHMVLSRLTALQRTQIGLLKAFGYSNREVGLHYMKLALVTVLAGLALGGALGLYAGTWLTEVYRDYYRFPRLAFEVSPHVLSLTLLIALAAAGLGALGAVRRAVRLPPAEAMRPEPPASFHAGLLERTGLSARLPPSARMIARSIARRRGRSSLAVLGIGCAVGILVVGRFGLDAMSYMLQVQFQLVQRDDATVLFTEPESAGIRNEVARLPGVLGVEPFRTVPARLRFEHRTKRIDLTGLPPDGELRRLVDEKLRPVQLPVAEQSQVMEATSANELEAARFRARSVQADAKAARAALLAVDGARGGAPAVIPVRSPVEGKVLRIPDKSERVVASGTPLLIVGDPNHLEVVIDLLSTEAVKVKAGMPVLLEGWGGERPLRARVRVVEPLAFTKVSALGVEEQRVNVIADFVDPPGALGDAFRVEARVVLWSGEDILKVPASALFRRGESWNVFVVEGGRARRREVEISHRGALEVEIEKGLTVGEQVIRHPSNDIDEGRRVRVVR